MQTLRNSAQVQAEIKRTRHRMEQPLYILFSIGMILLLLFCLLAGYGTTLMDHYGSTPEEIETFEVLKMIGYGLPLVLVLYLVFVALFGHYICYGKVLSNAIRVTEKNFPEIYEKSREFAGLLGMKKVPEVYIAQENGSLNAFATIVPGRKYIQLNAEIVDVAYMENHDLETVSFVMGHEFGHLYFKHSGIVHHILTFVGRLIPIVGPLLSRSQEYSCDRVAQALTASAGTREMMMMAAGRHLYYYADAQDYIDNILKKRNFVERLSVWVTSILSSHPIIPLRLAALADPQKKSGALFSLKFR